MSSHGIRGAFPVRVAARTAATIACITICSVQTARADAPSPQPPVYVGERWVCRPADPGNTPNAAMSGGTHPLRCRAVSMTLTTSSGHVSVIGKPAADASGTQEERVSMTSPAADGNLAPKDLHDSWVAMVKKGLMVDDTGSNGTVTVDERWVCRAADAQHPANASTTSAGGTAALSCNALNLSMQNSAGQLTVIGRVQARRPSPSADANQTAPMSAPSYAGDLTVQQVSDNWNAFVNRVFNTATSAAGGG